MRYLAIDQSYQNIGFGISEDNQLITCWSVNLSKFKKKTTKRKYISKSVALAIVKYRVDFVIVERTRLFSQKFLSQATVIALGGLVSTIVDASYPKLVYSVDTRSWKSKVLGSAKSDKEDAVKFVLKLGFDVDHDASDAACMSLYPFKTGASLKEEK